MSHAPPGSSKWGMERTNGAEELPVNLHYTRLELVLESRDILRLIRIDAVAAKTGWNLQLIGPCFGDIAAVND